MQTTRQFNFKKRTISIKSNPQTETYAKISFILKSSLDYTLDENEFKFILASAIQQVHGDIANEADLLGFNPIHSTQYTAFIKFKTIHFTRVITSLILFGRWKETDCKFEICKVAQTPCLLSVQFEDQTTLNLTR